MLTASTPNLDLVETWLDSDSRGRVVVAFPINRFTGADDSAVVYFEVAPGDYLPNHTDSAEEVLYIVAGQGELQLGQERGSVRAGDLAVIPVMVPTLSPTLAMSPSRSLGSSATARSSRRLSSRCSPWGSRHSSRKSRRRRDRGARQEANDDMPWIAATSRVRTVRNSLN